MVKRKGSSNSKEEELVVLDYLTKVNRPYSATDIFNNLHGKYTKGNIAKALEKLIEEEAVLGKVYGKSTIYTVKQTKQDDALAENTENISKSITETTEALDQITSENRALDQELAAIKNEPTTEEAIASIEKITQENEQLKERLDKLKNGTELIPPEERKKTNQQYDLYKSEWKKRRLMFKDIFGTITEHMPGNPAELKEKLGIEEDEVPLESI